MVTLIGDGGHARDILDAFPGLFSHVIPHHKEAVELAPMPYVLGMNFSHTRWRAAKALHEAWWFAYRRGVVVMPNAWIGPDVVLGDHTHVNFNAGLTRCTLGHFVTVGPGAVICGDVTIGDRTMVGAGAVIKNLLSIGSDVTIGAGAVVVKDVPDGRTVVGVPAR